MQENLIDTVHLATNYEISFWKAFINFYYKDLYYVRSGYCSGLEATGELELWLS
jgi:hypothetical protein